MIIVDGDHEDVTVDEVVSQGDMKQTAPALWTHEFRSFSDATYLKFQETVEMVRKCENGSAPVSYTHLTLPTSDLV